MMNKSIQRNILNSGLPLEFSSLWNATTGSLHHVQTGPKIIYRFDIDGRRYFLKIITALWTLSEIEAATDYAVHVSKVGAPVCRLIPSINGKYIEELQFDDHTVFATVSSEITGETVTNKCSNLEIYKLCGIAVAKLHRAAETYKPRPNLHFLSWDAEWQKIGERISCADSAALNEFHTIGSWFEDNLPVAGGFGLTHADCHAGNFVFDGENVQIIDFDEPVYHWYASDVARPFRELAHKPHDQRLAYFQHFLTGYNSVRSTGHLSLEHIAYLIRMKNLDIYTWQLSVDPNSKNEDGMIYIWKQFTDPVNWDEF